MGGRPVITTASVLVCAHQGQLSLHAQQSKLTAGGSAVLLLADLPGSSISGCSTPADPNTGSLPCQTVASVIAGQATGLTVDGTPALTDQAQGLTTGTVGGVPQTWSVRSAGQNALVTT